MPIVSREGRTSAAIRRMLEAAGHEVRAFAVPDISTRNCQSIPSWQVDMLPSGTNGSTPPRGDDTIFDCWETMETFLKESKKHGFYVDILKNTIGSDGPVG